MRISDWSSDVCSSDLGGAADGDTTTTAEDGSGEEPGGTLVIYSGRNEELVGPLVADFEEATGISVEIRYGDTAELAAPILAAGDTSPADAFFGPAVRSEVRRSGKEGVSTVELQRETEPK